MLSLPLLGEDPNSMNRVTIFSWGYCGWGNATEQLVKAVDAVERSRGFKPPQFVDIRIHRNVRAAGFRADAFEHVAGRSRYLHMDSLGNLGVLKGDSARVQIKDPSAAEELLDLALAAGSRNQRLLFFCSCEFPRDADKCCHRVAVASLVLQAARRRDAAIEIVEWPGSEPTAFNVDVSAADFRSVRGGRKSIPLGKTLPSDQYTGAPWGSIVTVRSGGEQIALITGPAKYGATGWYLPLPLATAFPSIDQAQLRRAAEKLRKEFGFTARQVCPESLSKSKGELFRYCIYTIAHLEKLKRAVKQNGTSTFTESRRWTTGHRLLRDANEANLRLLVLFGDANDCSRLLYSATLTDIKMSDGGTAYSFENLRRIAGSHSPQELYLHSADRRIAPGYIRPYAICRTPEFVRQ